MDQDTDSKPTLTLLPGNPITAESIEALYEQLTGKKPTPEESARLRERFKDGPHDAPERNRNANRD